MAGTLGDLIVRVGAKIDGFQTAMQGVLDSTEKTIKGVESKFSSLDKLGSRLQGIGTSLSAAISLPLIGAGTLAVRSAMEMESLELALRGVAGSAEATQAQMRRLTEVAKLPGLGLEEAIRASVNLQSAGLSAQQAERYIRAFGNALAGVGKGKAELQSVIEQLRQMSSKTKVTADDLRPIMNAAPQVAKIVRESFGTIDTEQLQKMGVSTSLFIETLVSGLEKLPPAANTTANTLENLQDALSRASAQMGKNLLPLVKEIIPQLEAMTKTLGDLGEQFSKLDPQAKAFWTNFAIGVAVTPIILAGIGSFVGVIKNLVVAFKALEAVGAFQLLFSPIGAIAAVTLGSLAIAYKELRNLDKLDKAGTDRVYADRLKRAQAADIEQERQAQAAWAKRDAEDARQRIEGIQKQLSGQKSLTDANEKYVKTSYKKLDVSIQERAELDLIGERYSDAKKWLEAYYTSKALDKQLTSELLQIGAGFRTELSAQTAEYAKQIEPLDSVAAGIEKIARAAAKLTDLKLPDGLKVSYDATTESMLKYEDRLKDLGVKSGEVLREHKSQVKEAMESTIAAYQSGAISLDEFKRVYGDLLKVYNGKETTKATHETKNAMTEVSTILTNMNQDIADSIINWKGFGDTAVSILKRIGSAILANVIGNLLNTTGIIKNVTSGMGSLLSKIGLGGASKVSDIGKSAVSSTTSSAGAASGITGAIGGISGAVNMVSGIASAIGSIGSMFMMSKMNSKLYAIESEMRGMVGNSTGLNVQVNQYLPALIGIEDRLKQIITGGLGVYSFPDSEVRVRMADNSLVGAGGTMQVVVNGGYFMTDGALDSFTDAFISRLRARGLKV